AWSRDRRRSRYRSQGHVLPAANGARAVCGCSAANSGEAGAMSELGRPFLPPDLRRLIEIGRHGGDPPIELKRNVGERLDRNLGLGGAMKTTFPLARLRDSPSEPPPPPSIAADIFGWKTFAGAMLGALTGGAALLVVASRAPHAPASSPNGDRVVEIHRNAPLQDPWLPQAQTS